MNPLDRVNASTDRWRDELVRLRRALHAHPEIAFEEHETAKRLQGFIEPLGIAQRTGVGGTGIVAMLEGGKPGPTIAVRADMDALPLTEPAGLPFASTVPGRMHACGHDAHMAIALGAAAVLSEHREELPGRVMFIFQPAEETLTGARAMLEAGLFDDIQPDAILGFHNWPQLPTGTVGWHRDAAMASSDAFDLTVRGLAGHGAYPHLGVDAIVAAAQFISQVQTIVSREIAPVTPAVVTIGRIAGGTVRNIIASSVEMNGSVRTLEPGLSATIEAAVRRMLDGLKSSLRVDYSLEWMKLTPVLRNDPAILSNVLEAARRVLGADRVVELTQPNMGSEDYAWFAERIPSAHLMIGSAIAGYETSIHRADYRLNEDAIPVGVRVIAAAVLHLMRRPPVSPRPAPTENA